MGRAHLAATFAQATPATGGPKSWPTATPQWRVHQSSRSWCNGDGDKKGESLQLSKKEDFTVASSHPVLQILH
jgi:hypothetical protein